eukprot:4279235-Amphidinium_carterae.1
MTVMSLAFHRPLLLLLLVICTLSLDIAHLTSAELGLVDQTAEMPVRAEAALPEGYTVWQIEGTHDKALLRKPHQ